MRTLRQLHLYLGCIFAPMIIYFSLSGVWQVFRFNDVPKNEVSATREIFHELSKPHTHSTLPGKDPKTEQSALFDWFTACMGMGMVLTSVFGIILALRFAKRSSLAVFCLVGGIAVPALFLILRFS